MPISCSVPRDAINDEERDKLCRATAAKSSAQTRFEGARAWDSLLHCTAGLEARSLQALSSFLLALACVETVILHALKL
jgi:hypothetical protein